MKKIIVGSVVALASIVASASAVDWSSGSGKMPGGATISGTGWTAVATLWDATGANVIGSSKDTTVAMGVFSGTWENLSTLTSYYSQLVITDAKGNSITSAKSMFTTDEAATYQINFKSGAGFNEEVAKIDYANGWKAADVPEPTSGLLMLLGFAGLALRRRRA